MLVRSSTEGTGSSAVTAFTYPGEMQAVYAALMVLTYVLFLTGAESTKRHQWLRAFIPVTAFVLWTMMQPSSAFDALGINLSGFARTMIAVIGAVAVGTLAGLLASRAQQAPAKKGGAPQGGSG